MFWLRKNKISSLLLSLLLLVLLSPTVFALFHPGFFLTDDGNWMVIRLSAFYDALRHGAFPPRFLLQLNHGYGYPVANFLYPLFMYVGVPIHLLGVNFYTTVKIILGISLLSSGLFTFLWLRKIFTIPSSIVGALLYVLFPYHLWDVYTRGSVGEVLALCIVPFILWQAERKKLVWASIGIALLILAHNSLALLFLPFLLCYFFLRKLYTVKEIVFLVLYALGLSAFFWVPALYDKQFTVFDKTTVSSFQNYFLVAGNSYLVGWLTLIVLLLTFPFLLLKHIRVFKFFWVITLLSLFLALPFSFFVWQSLHIVPYFQFPYRMLSLTIWGVAFLSAAEIEMLPRKIKVFGIFLLVVVAYFSSWNLLFPRTFQYYPDSFYSTNQDSTTVRNEYMPIWVKEPPQFFSQEKVRIIEGSGTVTDILARGATISFNALLLKPSLIQIDVVYFPGWNIRVDGKTVPLSYANSHGVMQVRVPAGVHAVKATFSETPVRLLSDIMSLFCIVILPFLVRRMRVYEA